MDKAEAPLGRELKKIGRPRGPQRPTQLCANPECQEAFIPQKDGQKYHERACYFAARVGHTSTPTKRITKICEVCGEEFECGGRAGKTEQRFHNRACAAAARWRTGSKSAPLSQDDAIYIASLIDGEGSIFLYKKRNGAALRVTVSNTNRAVLEWLTEVVKCGSIITKAGNERHKESYQWQVNAQAAETLLIQIIQYLKIKPHQAELVLEFQQRLRIPAEKANPAWQRDYLAKVQALNKRGPGS